jgi:hypothetical protein
MSETFERLRKSDALVRVTGELKDLTASGNFLADLKDITDVSANDEEAIIQNGIVYVQDKGMQKWQQILVPDGKFWRVSLPDESSFGNWQWQSEMPKAPTIELEGDVTVEEVDKIRGARRGLSIGYHGYCAYPKEQINVLQKTIEELGKCGKTPEDVEWVGVSGTYITWDEFTKLADFDSIPEKVDFIWDVMIVGDNWWLEATLEPEVTLWKLHGVPPKPKVKEKVSTLRRSGKYAMWSDEPLEGIFRSSGEN